MARWSWVPGLPTPGSSYDIWAVDPSPAGKELSEFDLLFMVVDGGDEAYLLSNTTGESVWLRDVVFIRQEHEKEYLPVGKRRLLIKRWRLAKSDEAENAGARVERPPEGARGELPTRALTEEDISQLEEQLPA